MHIVEVDCVISTDDSEKVETYLSFIQFRKNVRDLGTSVSKVDVNTSAFSDCINLLQDKVDW